MVKSPFLSFDISLGEKATQHMLRLDSEQYFSSKVSKNSKLEVGLEMLDAETKDKTHYGGLADQVEEIRESASFILKGSEGMTRRLQSSGDRLHSLKVPQAVVAFAQAAAKANDLPGWPLLSPSFQMQKCDKCSKEFCSPFNHRRHVRIHRRSLNADKNLNKERSQVAAYWNGLTPEEASNIISFKNMMIEDLSGTSAVRALSSYLQQHNLPSLPQQYLKAGIALLEIVQDKASRFPISADVLMSILDDASERTFLCGGTSLSVQRYVYWGDARKVGLEDRNLVASLGFLVEHKIVKAWMAEKDAEALRCQEALVEEEEAAQQKKAKLMERKRLKKIRQKEVKERERKGTDFQLTIQILDAGSLGDEVGSPRTVEEDDLPFVTSSSSSSVISSGQDFTETELQDLVISQHLERHVENGFTVLANEEHYGGWERYDASKEDSHNLDEQLVAMPEASDVAETFQVGTCDNDKREKSVMLDIAGPKAIAEKKFVRATKERKRPNYMNMSVSVQQPRDDYAFERRFYQDTSHFSLKPARRSYTTVSNARRTSTDSSSHEYFPRSHHYRRNTPGVRNLSTGNTYAVWTKKVKKSIENQEGKADGKEDLPLAINDTQKTNEDEISEYSSQVSPVGASDANEDYAVMETYDSQIGFSSADDSMEGLETARALLSGASNSTSSLVDVQSDGVSYHLRCLYMTASCNDSAVAFRGNLIVDKEEQNNLYVDCLQPSEQLSELDMREKEVNSCPTGSQSAQGLIGNETLGGSLLVGSLNVPLGNYGAEKLIHMQVSPSVGSDSYYAAMPLQDLEGRKCESQQKGSLQIPTAVDMCELLRETEKDVASSMPGILSDEKFQTSTNINLKPPKSPPSGTGHEGENTGKQGSWPNGFSKMPTLKVWRAVGRVGERQEDLVTSDIHSQSFVVKSPTEDETPFEEVGDESYSAEVDRSEGSVLLFAGSVPDQQIKEKYFNATQMPEQNVEFELMASTEPTASQHSECEGGLAQDELLEGRYAEVVFNPKRLANFLSERWATAIQRMDTFSAQCNGVHPLDSVKVQSFLEKV